MKRLVVVAVVLIVVAGCIRVIINVGGKDVVHKQDLDLDAANINMPKEAK